MPVSNIFGNYATHLFWQHMSSCIINYKPTWTLIRHRLGPSFRPPVFTMNRRRSWPPMLAMTLYAHMSFDASGPFQMYPNSCLIDMIMTTCKHEWPYTPERTNSWPLLVLRHRSSCMTCSDLIQLAFCYMCKPYSQIWGNMLPMSENNVDEWLERLPNTRQSLPEVNVPLYMYTPLVACRNDNRYMQTPM